jgi:hypothetical protein
MTSTLREKAYDISPAEAAAGRYFRDDAARALRAAFSSNDNWPNLSEAERDE